MLSGLFMQPSEIDPSAFKKNTPIFSMILFYFVCENDDANQDYL